MKSDRFDELLESVREGGRIRRGDALPSRVTRVEPLEIKAIRAELDLSQVAFARMIGVSVATLRNWEQGRRVPEGPAQALLRVAQRSPQAVAEALLTRARASKVSSGGRKFSRDELHER